MQGKKRRRPRRKRPKRVDVRKGRFRCTCTKEEAGLGTCGACPAMAFGWMDLLIGAASDDKHLFGICTSKRYPR